MYTYRVLAAKTASELQELVMMFVNIGYSRVGGVSVSGCKKDRRFYQAIEYVLEQPAKDEQLDLFITELGID